MANPHNTFEMTKIIRMIVAAAGAALLNKMLEQRRMSSHGPLSKDNEFRGKIIEIDDYEIVDEVQNIAPKGYKVKIQDG